MAGLFKPEHILAHRGWWSDRSNCNSPSAISRALSAGFGIETDLRDKGSTIVISHDPPEHHIDYPTFDWLLECYQALGTKAVLALNIKADGLAEPVVSKLRARGIDSYFVFDMSVPDTLGYLVNGANVFTRWSEFETGSLLDADASGLWIDSFRDHYVSPTIIDRAHKTQKPFALVSPELHDKAPEHAWSVWRTALLAQPGLEQTAMICTDLPMEALKFFSVIN